jgi:hypothetical protein
MKKTREVGMTGMEWSTQILVYDHIDLIEENIYILWEFF